MTIFLGVLLQLVISFFCIVFGALATTNLGFSDPDRTSIIVGIVLLIIGGYGIYDLATMFTFTPP